MNAHHKFFKAFLPCVIVAFTPALHGQHISDIKLRYSGTAITEAKLENVGTLPVDFYRQNLEVEVGLGQSFVGMTYQYATKKKHSRKLGNKFGKVEDGAMLTAGYNHIFSDRFRLETQGRVEIWGDTNPAHALHAAETDLRMNLILFDADGAMFLGESPLFPSLQAGVSLNKFGRVQATAGASFWWSGLGFYLAGYQALNGVEEALNPGSDADKTFANLKNSGVSLGMTYELGGFQVLLKHNYAIMNGGNDLTLSLQYQYFFRHNRR